MPLSAEFQRACARRARHQHDRLRRAVRELGLSLDGPPRLGWGAATIAAAVTTPGGEPRWLRLALVPTGRAAERDGAAAEAAALLGDRVPMPLPHGTAEWDDVHEPGRRVRAELYDYLPAPTVSATPDLTGDPGLGQAWWRRLRTAAEHIAASGTSRVGIRAELVVRRVREVAGSAIDPQPRRWAPAHGDWHWANLVAAPDLVILDWEGYGLAPEGWDAALLYTYSLASPDTAARVRRVFADVLGGAAGRLAQVFAAAEVLTAVDRGEHPRLERPVRRHLAALLDEG